MAMADNVGGARIIGTTTEFFTLQPSLVEASPFQIADGRYFEDLDLDVAHDDHGHDEEEGHAEDEEHHDEEEGHAEDEEHHDEEEEHAEDEEHHDEEEEHAEDEEHHDEEDEHAEDEEHHDEEEEHAEDEEHHDEEEEHAEDEEHHDDEDEHAHDEGEHAEIEAVLGALAAAELGLTIGDEFVTTHGTGPGLNADAHDSVHVIVGIMQPTNTVFDRAVFVPVSAVWETHAEIIPDSPLDAVAIENTAFRYW